MNDITKDAKYILLTLYKDYLTRRKSGKSRQESAYWSNSNKLQSAFFPTMHADDVADCCWELHRKEYISCVPGDDIANHIMLLPDTIVAMEQRFPKGMNELLDTLGKIAALLPFI